MKNYYKILGINKKSRRSEVRKAYRQKAKSVHPDVSQASKAEEAFIVLREAFEVLYDPYSREQYDKAWLVFFGNRGGFNYRDFLKDRQWDKEYQAKLMCYDLLHSFEEEAVRVYEQFFNGVLEELRYYLNREDFMDYSFLIAEEYLKRECPVKAFSILMYLALEEEKQPYFRHFYPEIQLYLRDITRRKIMDNNDKTIRLGLLKQLFKLDYPVKEKAEIYRQTSELYVDLKDLPNAIHYYKKATATYPRLSGCKRIREKLGIALSTA